MRNGTSLAALGLLALFGAGAACADDTKMPPPAASPARPSDQDAGKSGTSDPPASLSEKLSNSGGVIRPPANIDPEMKQHTPPTGPQSMPVVPPPGTPGGDPTVKPK